jgi:putative redox protein
MSALKTIYDESQHCTAIDQVKGKSVAMDCPYTGKGEELSPGNLLEAALSGCMLMSMGAVAMRDNVDLTNTSVDVELIGTPPPKIGYNAINITLVMPAGLSGQTRQKLERAADTCPIKHSIDSNIPVSVEYRYPD